MTWETRAVCRTRPADWWDTADEGNRLAMTLCRLACPVIADCLTGDPEPAGVIRAGVAYSDRGLPLPECACGRPIVGPPARPGWCRICEPAAQRNRVHGLPRRRGQHAVFPCGTWQAYQRHVRHREPTCDEPPTCTPCGVYASQACPMVAGRQSHYADRERLAEGRRGHVCPDDSCGCGGYIPSDPSRPDAGGDPAHPWYAVYTEPAKLQLTGNEVRVPCSDGGCSKLHRRLLINGARLVAAPLKVVLVSAPGVGRVWRRLTVDEVAEVVA